ncbi:MAG TPA: DUF5362 family protein [Pseudolabrys sp.]|jgi:type IV secretory pathway TrbD component
MLFLRIIGIAMILLGLVLCITIIGAAIGVPMILIGAVLVFVGRKRAPIIVQVVHEHKTTNT